MPAPPMDPHALNDNDECAYVFEPGEILEGKYEIVRPLGRGGMGQVFDARDHDLNRHVAIKTVVDEKLALSLLQEGRALAAIHHQNLLQVHAFGRHQDRTFLVMERVIGELTSDRVASRSGQRLPLNEALEILVPVAEGLTAVHRAGVAHRDVKPSNIMITPEGRVVLLDFGLVVPEFALGSTARAAGTPRYMAPECLRGVAVGGSGFLLDVFALGVTAYTLISGVSPFDSDNPIELQRLHNETTPEPLTRVVDGTPIVLSDLVREMLHVDPYNRVQSMEDAAWRLKAIHNAQGNRPSASRARMKPSQRSLLVIDDDVMSARAIARLVSEMLGDIDVRIASSGLDGLNMLREREADVLVVDLHMPTMSGIEVLMSMRGEQLGKKALVLAASANASESDLKLLQQVGVSHCLRKGPEIRAELRRALTSLGVTQSVSAA